MRSELARVSISLEDALLDTFDHFIGERGYATRSEAIRDLIREKLLGVEGEDDGRTRVGVLSLVFDGGAHELMSRLAERQQQWASLVVTTMQVQLGQGHGLQVYILRGAGKEIRGLSDALLSIKGVLHGDLRMTGDGDEFAALAGQPEAQASEAQPRRRRRRRFRSMGAVARSAVAAG